MKKIIIILMMLFTTDADADEWTKGDTQLQLAYSALHIIDWSQTIEIGSSKEYKEDNVILGESPNRKEVNKYFLSTLILHYFVSRNLNKPYRELWQTVTIIIEQDCIRNNVKNGFAIKLNF